MYTRSGKKNPGGTQKTTASRNNSKASKIPSSEASWSTVPPRAPSEKHTASSTQLTQPTMTKDVAEDIDADDEETFTTVTLACFPKLQQPIFALVTHLVSEPSATNNPFTKKWQEAMQHPVITS